MIKVSHPIPQGIFSVVLPIQGMFVQDDVDLYHNSI